MADHQDDPATLIVPFGKHQGLTVAELLVRDPAYVEWLLAQSWLAQRFAKLHEAIITRGATPDDTPEHNQIQARFLDPAFALAAILIASPEEFEKSRYSYPAVWDFEEKLRHWKSQLNYWKNWGEAQSQPKPDEPEPIHPGPNQDPVRVATRFEQGGVDAAIFWSFSPKRFSFEQKLYVEIKPSLGDDYPAVMRQMARLHTTALVIEQYSSSNLPLSTVREMFKSNGQILITIQEILDKIPDAKNFMEK